MTDEELRALTYDKRALVKVGHMIAIKRKTRDYAINKLAPSDGTNPLMPVMRSTGAIVDGRNRLTWDDVIKYKGLFGPLNLPDTDLDFILSSEHETDLLLDGVAGQAFRNVFYNNTNAEFNKFLGFNFWKNNKNNIYDAGGNLKSDGAVMEVSDRNASLVFHSDNTVFHREKMKALYKPETTDTRSASPTSEFRLQGHLVCEKKQEIGFGSIISGSGT